MGLILPVNHYQYQDYQKRIKGIKINNFRTVGIEKVKKAYLWRVEPFSKGDYPADNSPRKQSENKAEKVYAQLTGIGGKFNDCI